jgi:hypothetical protein
VELAVALVVAELAAVLAWVDFVWVMMVSIHSLRTIFPA